MLGIPNLVTLGVLVVWALMGVELYFATRAQLLAAGSTATHATIMAVIKGITSPIYLAYKAIIGLVKAVVAEFSLVPPAPVTLSILRRRRRRPKPTPPAPPDAAARRRRRK